MTVRREHSPPLPSGLSPAEEARWWDEHRDYWDADWGADELIEPTRVTRTTPVNLRLPVDMVDRLKQEAERRSLPYQTLIRMWLRDRLDSESA